MARCLLAWELGANYGHLVALRAFARALKRHGHDCVFAVRSLGDALEFLEPQLGPVVQAPARSRFIDRPVRRQLSYASLLHNVGFGDPVELAGRIRAWQSLYRAFGTELVFADHSPIALVAARTLGIPAVAFGNGFTLPPRSSPFPAFAAGARAPQALLLRNEAHVLNALNAALARLRLRPFELLQDIFRGARRALLSYAPLDHYGLPRSEPYLGLPDYAYGSPPAWPAGKGPRIFAYLRAGRGVAALLRALERTRARVLLRWAGARPAALSGKRLAVTGGPVNFRAAAESCDIFVNYGAHSTVAEFLLAGKPGLLMPDLQERALVAHRAVATGAALALSAREPARSRMLLERLIDDPAPRRAARQFAARYADQDRDGILPRFVAESL